MDGFFRSNSRFGPRNDIGILNGSSRPVPALPFNHHGEDAPLGLRRREVFIAVTLEPQAPGKQGKRAGQGSWARSGRRKPMELSTGVRIDSLIRPAGKRGVLELEFPSALNPIAAGIHKVQAAGQDQCRISAGSVQNQCKASARPVPVAGGCAFPKSPERLREAYRQRLHRPWSGCELRAAQTASPRTEC